MSLDYVKLISAKEVAVYSVPTIFGTIINYAYGGWTQWLHVMFVCIAIDYLTGIVASLREGKGIESKVGFWGLTRKSLMLLSVFIAHQLDLAMGTNWIMSSSIIFWVVNELVSITENYGRIGLPMPTSISKAIKVLKDKMEIGKDEINKGE